MPSPDIKPNICFITTRGEITQGNNSGVLSPRLVAPGLQDMVNMTEVDLTQGEPSRDRVVSGVHQRLLRYDGFVVTAGRQNLSGLASYAAFALGPDLDRPVVFTGTNITASMSHSGAREQLLRATMAASTLSNQVLICVNDKIVSGTNFRMERVGTNLIGFNSYYPGQTLGEFIGAGIEGLRARNVPRLTQLPPLNRFASHILPISPTLGISDDLREGFSRMNPNGVVLTTDGRSVPDSALPMIGDFTARGIPVLVINNVPDSNLSGNGSAYATETNVENAGAIAVRGLGHDVALVKFSWAVQKALDEIDAGSLSLENKIVRISQFMQTPYVGEFGSHRPFTIPI